MHCQLSGEQIDQFPNVPHHRREQQSTLPEDFNMDVMADLEHKHVPMRDAVKQISEVVHDESLHLVELCGGERRRCLKNTSPKLLAFLILFQADRLYRHPEANIVDHAGAGAKRR